MLKDYKTLEEIKITHEIGMLYNYLNIIENDIQSSISGNSLIQYYNLKSNGSYKNRSACPLHNGNNKTSLEFKDDKRTCQCHSSCGNMTYVQFIAKMENMTNLNEAKIFAATKFSNINLGFNSLEDYKDILRSEIKSRYNEIGSLNLKDYYDISILPDKCNKSSTITSYSKKFSSSIRSSINDTSINSNDELLSVDDNFKLKELSINTVIKELDINCIKEKGYTNYSQALITAYNSKLIKDFTQTKNELNSNEKLYEFIMMKYNITPDIIDKYELIFFEKANQPLLHYKDFTQISDRVLFPVKDHETGLIVGYQGRNTNLKLTERCKYINISDYNDNLDTDDNGKEYRKMIPLPIGNFLFNLYELKDEPLSNVWITEGIADAIKLTSLGYKSISPGQSNITEHQIQLLDRYFGKDIEINLFFDTDSHKVGQTNSIKIAYKLWQFGFKNINIIRTYAEIGKDITDCSVKLKDDNLLVIFINLWYKYAYKFIQAPNEDLDALIKTKVYNQDTALTIDPRYIKDEIEFATKYSDINEFIPLMDQEIRKNPVAKIKNGDISFIRELVLKARENSNNNDPNSTQIPKITNILPDTSAVVVEKTSNTETNSGVSFARLSPKQVFILKKRHDDETIKNIDNYLTDKQINSIIWKINTNQDFDINKYLMSSKYKETLYSKDDTINDSTHSHSSFDADLIPVDSTFCDDDAPF